MHQLHLRPQKGNRRSFFASMLIVGFVIASMFFLSMRTGIVLAATLCSAKSYGAAGDGTTKDTAALQKAINACAGKGAVVCTTSVSMTTHS